MTATTGFAVTRRIARRSASPAARLGPGSITVTPSEPTMTPELALTPPLSELGSRALAMKAYMPGAIKTSAFPAKQEPLKKNKHQINPAMRFIAVLI
jgi:hypothetical protein